MYKTNKMLNQKGIFSMALLNRVICPNSLLNQINKLIIRDLFKRFKVNILKLEFNFQFKRCIFNFLYNQKEQILFLFNMFIIIL